MQDIFGLITTRRRPRLLNDAARLGARDYNRDTQLRKLLGTATLPRNGDAVLRLLDLESDLDDKRRAKSPDYTVTRHVAVWIAILGESHLMRASRAV